MESIALNMIPKGVAPLCYAAQYDVGRTIRVNLLSGLNSYVLDGTETVTLNVRKPDNTIVTAELTNTEDSYVTFETTEQMTAISGMNKCSISIAKSGDIIASLNFFMSVQADVLSSGIPSESEIKDLGNQVNAYLDENVFIPETLQKTIRRDSELFTLYGTKGYASLTDGHFISNANYNLLKLVFTEDTDIYITKDSGQLVGAILYSQDLTTIPTSSSQAAAYFVRAGRSNESGDTALPTQSNKWHCLKDQMLAIFTQDIASQGYYYDTNFTLGFSEAAKNMEEGILLSDTQKSQILSLAKTPLIKYGGSDTDLSHAVGVEQITIYLPTAKGFIKYAFVRCVSDAKNTDSWRIDRAYACDDNLEVLFPITNEGEWELAIKINGGSDFIGGIAHGNEVLTSFTLLVDGKYISDLRDLLTIRSFDEVQIIETTNLYDPTDGATLSTKDNYTPIASHGRAYIVTEDGIRLNQELTFSVAKTLTTSYMTMLPIYRGNDTASDIQITDHYYSDKDFVVYDVSVGESGSAGYGWRSDVSKASIWGETSGICATVEMLRQPSQDLESSGGKKFQVQDTLNEYNKLYWSICGVGGTTYNATVGERFNTETHYKITAN